MEGIEQLSAHNKSVRFTLRAGDRPLWVQMDFERLVSAFQNLLDNAVHFSAEGGAVEIDVTETGRKITCTIRDHGPGFEPGDHEKVFQPFFTRRPAGTGLGLSIVQKIFHEHGGEVTVANHPDGGAIVTVRLPLLTHPH